MILRWLLGKWELALAGGLGLLAWFFKWRSDRNSTRADKAESKARYYKDREERRRERAEHQAKVDKRLDREADERVEEAREREREGLPRKEVPPWGEQ